VRAVLAIKSIDYELVAVMPGAIDPDFKAKSPLSKIPVWEEGDYVLPDSSVICAYLEKIHPDPAVYPSEARAYGRSLFWEEYADTRLVESVTPVFFQRIVNAKVFKQPIDEEIVRRHAEEVLPPVHDQLESLFVASGIASASELTVAEIAVWSVFVNFAHAGLELDRDRWPELTDFISAMNAHPMLAPLIEEERASLLSL
jgi:glutathione S-transferase